LQKERYQLDYSLSGKHLALASEKGHIAILDWKSRRLKLEININDKIRDVKFLQGDQTFAVALNCSYSSSP